MVDQLRVSITVDRGLPQPVTMSLAYVPPTLAPDPLKPFHVGEARFTETTMTPFDYSAYFATYDEAFIVLIQRFSRLSQDLASVVQLTADPGARETSYSDIRRSTLKR